MCASWACKPRVERQNFNQCFARTILKWSSSSTRLPFSPFVSKKKQNFFFATFETFGPANGLPIPSRSFSLPLIYFNRLRNWFCIFLFYHIFTISKFFLRSMNEQRKAVKIFLQIFAKKSLWFFFFALLLCKSTVFQILWILFFFRVQLLSSISCRYRAQTQFLYILNSFLFLQHIGTRGFEWQGDVEATEKRMSLYWGG